MYVCICNALKDRELADAARDARSVGEVFRRCNKRPQCGKCLPDVANFIECSRNSEGHIKIAAE